MKKLLLFALTAALSTVAFAQDDNYNKRFNEALNDSLPLAEEVLADWEKNGPKNGDYYAAQFNFHFHQGVNMMVTTSTDVPFYAVNDCLEMQDSLGNVAGYMYQGVFPVDQCQIDSSFVWIKKGIELFPSRLDLRMGYATAYKMLDDKKMMYTIVAESVDWALKNPNTPWLWTSDEILDSNDSPLASSIQEYFGMGYNCGIIDLALVFANLGLRLEPNNVMFLNDKAILLLDNGNVQGALDLMKQALKIDPDDEIIKGNIEYLEESLKNDNN